MSSTDTGDDTLMNDVLGGLKTSVQNIVDFSKTVGNIALAGGKAIQGAAGSAAGAAQAAASAEIDKGKATQDINTIEGQAAIQKKNDDSIVAQALGVTSQQAVARAGEIKQTQDQVLGYDKQLQDAAGKTLLTDPLGWIGNLIKVPIIQEQRDRAQTTYEDQTKFLNDNQAMASHEFAISSSLDIAASSQLIAAKNKQAADDAQVAASTALERAASFNIEAINAATASSREALDASFKGMAAQSDMYEKLRQKEVDEVTLPSRQIAADIKNETLATRNAEDLRLKAASVATNGAIPADRGSFKAISGPQKDAMNRVIDSLPYGSYGVAPVESLNNAINAGINPLTAGEAETRNFIGNSVAVAQKQYNPQQNGGVPWNRVDVATRTLTANTLLDKQISLDLTDVSKPGSIYSTPTYDVAMKLPIIANSPLGQLLKPLANGKSTVNGSDLINAAVQLSSKIPVSEVAKQIVDVSKSLMAATNAANMPNKYRLPSFGSEKAPGYNMVYDTGQVWGSSSRIIDFSNPAQVEAAIARVINNRKFSNTQLEGRMLGASP